MTARLAAATSVWLSGMAAETDIARLSERRTELVGFRKSGAFEGFERDFLRQHDVSRDQTTIRHNAPPYPRGAIFSQFKDIRANSQLDAVRLAALAADHVEVPFRIELGELRGGKPRPQESQAAEFGRVRIPGAPEKAKDGPRTPLTLRGLPSQPEQGFHPPTRRGKNNVSFAVGSNDLTRRDSPVDVRSAAMKPAPVNSLNRLSAFATASASRGSN